MRRLQMRRLRLFSPKNDGVGLKGGSSALGALPDVLHTCVASFLRRHDILSLVLTSRSVRSAYIHAVESACVTSRISRKALVALLASLEGLQELQVEPSLGVCRPQWARSRAKRVDIVRRLAKALRAGPVPPRLRHLSVRQPTNVAHALYHLPGLRSLTLTHISGLPAPTLLALSSGACPVLEALQLDHLPDSASAQALADALEARRAAGAKPLRRLELCLSVEAVKALGILLDASSLGALEGLRVRGTDYVGAEGCGAVGDYLLRRGRNGLRDLYIKGASEIPDSMIAAARAGALRVLEGCYPASDCYDAQQFRLMEAVLEAGGCPRVRKVGRDSVLVALVIVHVRSDFVHL
jgi:hypothetical protein